MKILFISAYYPPRNRGGAEISAHLLARALVARGHEVTVVTDGSQRGEAKRDKVRVISAPLGLQKKPLFEQAAARRSARLLSTIIKSLGDFDIVHAHDFRSALAVSELEYPRAVVTMRDYAALSGCTNNITADGSVDPGCGQDERHCHRVAEASWPRSMVRLWQYSYNKSYRREAFGRFGRQIYISHAQKDVIGRFLPLTGKQVAVIYNPIAPEDLSAQISTKISRTILYAGRVEMYKGVDILLAAWRQLQPELPGWKLIVVGDGAQRLPYERLVATWGMQYQVEFKPHMPYEKLPTLYDGADILVAPHRWIEPFGRTVAEGMARGRIVVAANAGGPREMIEIGKTGWLFERADKKSLVTALRDAARMNHYDRREMQRAAREWVNKNLTMDVIAKQHEEFYTSKL